MVRYLLQRLVQAALVLVLLSIATRALLSAMPGDPVESLRRASPRPLSAADLERLKRHYGLDDPFFVQYAKWLRQVATGDLGYSRTYQVPVTQLLWPALVRTLAMTGSAFLLALVIAVPLGIRSATMPGSADDRFIRLLCYLGISVPPFWMCLVAIHWLAVRWRLLPPDAQIPPGPIAWYEAAVYLVLPILVITALLSAEWIRYVRSGLRDVLDTPYIRAARARGIGEGRILCAHALPNAIVPFLTVVGLTLPYLVGGELVVETVFAWPGIGQLEYNAIREQDHNVAMAALLVIAAVALAGSLLVDLAHAALDPRVRKGLGTC
jgi:peptide/nickel transport system permease protein